MRNGLIPTDGNVFVYTISSFDLITQSPKETVEKLQCIYVHALGKMSAAIQKGNSINVLGISLGNVLSIRLAGQAQKKMKNIVSIVGGGNLGLSGWDSILTGRTARQSGCSSPQEYEDRLAVFSPVNHVGGIEAEKVIIRLGTHDRLIPFSHGEKLVGAFTERSKKSSMKIDYKAYRGADHASALFFSSFENLCRTKIVD